MKKRIFDLEKTLINANKIQNIDERILYLRKEIKEYKQLQDSWSIDMDNYDKKVDEEINYLMQLKKSNKAPIQGKTINPIWWQKSDRQLGYLIENLAKLGYIDRGTDINKAIKDHFINKDKKPFPDSIKQNRSGTGINKNSKPKGSTDIDNVINNLKE